MGPRSPWIGPRLALAIALVAGFYGLALGGAGLLFFGGLLELANLVWGRDGSLTAPVLSVVGAIAILRATLFVARPFRPPGDTALPGVIVPLP